MGALLTEDGSKLKMMSEFGISATEISMIFLRQMQKRITKRLRPIGRTAAVFLLNNCFSAAAKQ